MAIYLDCNATTPMEPEVLEVVLKYMRDEYGNAGSRTHEFGLRAKKAVERAREQVAAVVEAQPEEVIFTSGATESNNLALFGMAEAGRRSGRLHIVSTAIEHKAVLEPLEQLAKAGFTVTLIPPNLGGRVQAQDIVDAVRPDTLLVSVMHVNNETGVIQPVQEVAKLLKDSETLIHADAAQGFGKEIDDLRDPRIDLISVSGHKIYGPKGIGALITRHPRTSGRLHPLLFGGGQERGLRPGTAPVQLIAGLGEASRIALRDHAARQAKCMAIGRGLRDALKGIDHAVNGDEQWLNSSTLNVSFPGIDSEAAMVALKDIVAVSNGSACTSASYKPSHVLQAMRLSDDLCTEAIRFSWCHLTQGVPWDFIARRLGSLM